MAAGLQRRIGLGVTLGVDIAGAGGSNYVSLGAIVNAIKNSGTKADVGDISLLADTWKQFAKGQIDPGEYTFECAYDPNDSAANQANTTARLQTMHAATGPNAYPFQITLPAVASPGTNQSNTINFSAHLTGMGLSIEKDKLIVTPVTIKVTGNPNL
jgi:hypothetical protein